MFRSQERIDRGTERHATSMAKSRDWMRENRIETPVINDPFRDGSNRNENDSRNKWNTSSTNSSRDGSRGGSSKEDEDTCIDYTS